MYSKIGDKMKKNIINYITKTSSGMAMGLFATLIIGSIINQLCSLGSGFQIGIDISKTLIGLMGPGIGLGVALSIKEEKNTLDLVSCMALGGIASAINLVASNDPTPTFTVNGGSKNPLLIYLVIIFTIIIVKKLLIKKTPIDILLIPITYILIGAVLGFMLIYPCYYLIYFIQQIISKSMPLAPITMSIIISVIMGMVLTMPISSVAVCVSISIGDTPLAAGAALIGCTCQMIGFATQSFRAKNNIGKSISVGIGTSMLYWPNIIKKPTIWLPTIVSSAILGPIGVYILNTYGTSNGAGMGSCGLVGQLSCLEVMGYSNPNAYISIFIVQILGSIIFTLMFDYIFKDILHLYTNDDLKLNI